LRASTSPLRCLLIIGAAPARLELASTIARDITERRQAETALAAQTEELSRQSQELMRSKQDLQVQTALLQSVLDNMGEGLVAADEHGNFTLWNPAAEKILGLGAAKYPARNGAGTTESSYPTG
jgi:PAS domain-containing protein